MMHYDLMDGMITGEAKLQRQQQARWAQIQMMASEPKLSLGKFALLMGCFSWIRSWGCVQKHCIHFTSGIHHMDMLNIQAVANHYTI